MNQEYCNNSVEYNIYEFDLFKLEKQIRSRGITSLIIWGIGNNGEEAYQLLKNIGVEVKYFVDVKAEYGCRQFKKRKVESPNKFENMWNGEYVVVTPSIHDDIFDWLSTTCIPQEKIIAAFYAVEKVSINYRHSLNLPSTDIEFCRTRPSKPAATFTTIVYDTPEYMFRRAIESVLRQSYKNFMYVIIVNGATDGSLEIANEYAALDARIIVIDMETNLRWTDVKLLNTIKDNIYGGYWCQLDSDDYYGEKFLEISLNMGDENNADIVCVRTVLFREDQGSNYFTDAKNFDFHDRYYFNIVHPSCHIIGHDNIIVAYAKSEICSTFWGKLYQSEVMRRFTNDLLSMPKEERELYFRLDIAWTYHILSISERIFYSDKILHYSSVRKSNSTFSLSPVEWLMSLCYAYTNIKREMNLYYHKIRAKKLLKRFIEIHLPWMIKRQGMLANVHNHNSRILITENLRMIFEDEIVRSMLLRIGGVNKNDYRNFYKELEAIIADSSYKET